MLTEFVPVFITVLLASLLGFGMLKLGDLLGPRRPTAQKLSPYESGMDVIGTARERYSVKFYLVAMIFIVFDVEIVFLYPWAVRFRQFIAEGVGGTSLAVVAVFVLILGIGLLYDIKKGGLEWD